MRVVATADIHNTKPRLPDGDMLLVCGDLTETGSLDQLLRFRDWLGSQTHKHKVVIAGNHDFCLEQSSKRQEAELALGSVCTYLFDQGTTIEGKTIYGSPWQPWFHNWAFNLSRGASLVEKWTKIPANLDILMVHGPPFGFGDRTMYGDSVGCQDLLAELYIKKPKYTLYGHIHEDTGAWLSQGLNFVNCSSDYGSKPAYEFDI